MSSWSYAEVWEAIAVVQPDAPALVHGSLRRPWVEMDRRADAVGAWLLGLGAGRQATVAQYLRSGPEYVESVFAAFKAGLVPFNTNYRYGHAELAYLWGNADAVAVVFHGAFVETVEALRADVPHVRGWLWVDDGSGPCPPWATPYEDVAAAAPGAVPTRGPWGVNGGDLFLIYTGGTTGMPKGVMWRQDDVFALMNETSAMKVTEEGTVDDVAKALRHRGRPGPVHVPCAPLMHGTGFLTSLQALQAGGAIATLTGRQFDAAELWDLVASAPVKSMAIVGDAFARPMLAALDAEPDRWDTSALRVITSSGVMWSAEVKTGLLRHLPKVILADSLGSSEAIGMASSVSSASSVGTADTATFRLGPRTRVLAEDGREVEPGSGERGLVAMRGRFPVGYFKDEAKSAATFREIDGVRWSVPGDWAEVEADGTVRLLGRGSQCINTGGEKVFPEEVEEVLKRHRSVADAAVVGVAHERFGEAITALVEPAGGATIDEAALIAHVKASLAAYKAPKRVVVVPTVGRAPNGKLDYNALKTLAAAI